MHGKLASFHWVWRRSLGINLDEDVQSSRRHAVGFTFGSSHAWEHFAVSPLAHCTLTKDTSQLGLQSLPCWAFDGKLPVYLQLARLQHMHLHIQLSSLTAAELLLCKKGHLQTQGTSSLQVYFACSDGSLFVLCPVAPFEATLPLSVVHQLLETSRDDSEDTACATTQAWLDQVI